MEDKKLNILVSACLIKDNCKYNGGNNYNELVCEFIKKHNYVKICPELMAGLPVPRPKMEMKDGNLIRIDGKDMSENMKTSLTKLEAMLENEHFDLAILKSKSPSCGYGEIYDGTFSKKLIKKNGFACECLLKHKIKILTELDFK